LDGGRVGPDDGRVGAEVVAGRTIGADAVGAAVMGAAVAGLAGGVAEATTGAGAGAI